MTVSTLPAKAPAPSPIVPGCDVSLGTLPGTRGTVISLSADRTQAFVRVWRSRTSGFAEWIPTDRLRPYAAASVPAPKGGLTR